MFKFQSSNPPKGRCLREMITNIRFLIVVGGTLLLVILFFFHPAHGLIELNESTEQEFNLTRKWTGDFDGMVERRLVRVLVVFSKTNYFLDGPHTRGATYEGMKAFEKKINKKLKRGHLKVNIVFIPVARDQLIPALVDGRGDIAAAALTVTPERQKQVDFADPLIDDIHEIVVTGKNSQKLSEPEDLSGRDIYVRESSSYYESLLKLNRSLKKSGKPEVVITKASPYLEDEDLMEMVAVGLIPITVVDNYLARFWSKIFKDIRLHPKIKLRKGGQIAWMIRKNSPELKKAINAFIKGHKKGTLFGNIILKRYFQNTSTVKNALADDEFTRFKNAISLFQKYGGKYDLDWLLVAALAYQESGIDQNKRSPAGAVGVMQILPSTAAGDPINIPDIEKMEPNIHAGVKYLRWLHDTFFKDEPMDPLNKALFTFASYNAGPTRVMNLRKTALKMGLSPNIWFNNVEVAAAKKIGRETVQYVSNIYKYYIAYRLIVEKLNKKREVLDQQKAL